MYVPEFSIPLNREDLCQTTEEGQYIVKYFFSPKEINGRLEDAKRASQEEGPSFIVDHFPTFFSLLRNFEQMTELNRQKAWTIILNSLKELISQLHKLFDDIKNVECETKNDMRNITKMICYMTIELMSSFQDKCADNDRKNIILDPKQKKKQKTNDDADCTEDKLEMLNEIYSLLELPLKMLWDPPVVDEEFVNLIANFCYKCLENPNISSCNMKWVRDTIFQIIGVLIKNYLHGLSFCVKIVQLLRSSEQVVNILAKGTVQLVQECKCTNIVKEIIREIAETDGDQLAADISGTRSLNLFLVQLAESVPETLIPAVDLLIRHLAGDSYNMRICVLEVLGEIVSGTLSEENLEEELKKMRDEFLETLEDHIHDTNAFARSRVLQIWQKLCSSNSIPISRLHHLLELTVGRINDKSTTVKKQAVHLVKDLLERNPYSPQLDMTEIKNQIKEETDKMEVIKKMYKVDERNSDSDWELIESKLKEIVEKLLANKENNVEEGDKGNVNLEEKIQEIRNLLLRGKYETAAQELTGLKDRCDTVFNMGNDDVDLIVLLKDIINHKTNMAVFNLPENVQEKLNVHKIRIEYLGDALRFAELINQALPLILTLLDSNVVTEVLESVHFFTAAYLFGFQQALEGVRKMLYLMYSKEDVIKSAVSEAYQKIYFDKKIQGRQQSLSAVRSLSELVLKLNESQLSTLELVVREWLSAGLIENNFIQILFERFSNKIANTSEKHRWAALVLIRMVGSQEPRIIKSNISVLLSQGLSRPENHNFLVAKEICKALQKLMPERQHGKPVNETLRYKRDHEIFIKLEKFLKVSLWRSNDPYYVPMAEEAINLVFQLCDQPDSFCEHLITEIHESIVNNVNTLKIKPKGNCKLFNGMEEIDESLGEEDLNSVGNGEDGLVKEGEEKEDASKDDTVILTRFISILGQVAANYILYLEGPVLNELKRRNQVHYERKLKKCQDKSSRHLKIRKDQENHAGDQLNKSEQEGSEDFDFNRVAADDMDAEEMKKKSELELVTGNGYFAKFTPLILTICKNPGKYKSKSLQNAAVVTLSKFMFVSSVFCAENLQLLVTICEKSDCPMRRKNAIIALGALQYRFPNTLEPWTQHMYRILRDLDSTVRLSAVFVLTDLVVNEMIKLRSNVSDLAVCLVDKDQTIAKTVRHFFREYSLKGNSLFNVIFCLISNLIRPDSGLNDDEFKTIMRFMLGLFTKDKQSEYLIDKLFQYFGSATTERQWKNISFCLSLLNYNEKSLKKILDNFKYFGNKLYLADVYEAFSLIVSNAAKTSQKDKAILKEIQDLMKECRDKSCEDKNVTFSVQKKMSILSTGKRSASRKVVVLKSENKEMKARKQLIKVKNEVKVKDEDEDDDDDAFLSDVSVKTQLKPRSGISKKLVVNSEVLSEDYSDNDECPKKQTKNVKSRSQAKRVRATAKYTDGTSEEDEKRERVLRGNRKRK